MHPQSKKSLRQFFAFLNIPVVLIATGNFYIFLLSIFSYQFLINPTKTAIQYAPLFWILIISILLFVSVSILKNYKIWILFYVILLTLDGISLFFGSFLVRNNADFIIGNTSYLSFGFLGLAGFIALIFLRKNPTSRGE